MAGTPARRVINGEEWAFYPLRFDDLGEIEKWLEDRQVIRLAGLMERHGKELPDDVKVRLMSDALATSARISLAGTFVWEELRTLEGMKLFLWLSVRQGRPGVTQEQMIDAFRGQHLGALRELIEVVSGLRSPMEDGGAPGESGPAAGSGMSGSTSGGSTGAALTADSPGNTDGPPPSSAS